MEIMKVLRERVFDIEDKLSVRLFYCLKIKTGWFHSLQFARSVSSIRIAATPSKCALCYDHLFSGAKTGPIGQSKISKFQSVLFIVERGATLGSRGFLALGKMGSEWQAAGAGDEAPRAR